MVKRWLQIVALVLVLAAAAALLVLPMYESVTTGSDGSEVDSTQTLLEVNGPWLLVLLAIPVALAAMPLFAYGRIWAVLSIVSACLLWACVILGGLTIGVFFVPGALLAVIAACVPVRSTRTAASPAV